MDFQQALSIQTFFFLFSVAPAAYGSSWARGQFRVDAATYTTATAMLDLSHICKLHCGLGQRQILHPLSEAKDPTYLC